ncbi:hypothetical protein BKA70DRAFT_1231429 [Coprinopsis sp. MPI-PUGE-AT-0042]|nr:hypothetical protein BKA70DRAFT_1231429 [Coprinopsis sp. MPI-PUGE-AT-0042]
MSSWLKPMTVAPPGMVIMLDAPVLMMALTAEEGDGYREQGGSAMSTERTLDPSEFPISSFFPHAAAVGKEPTGKCDVHHRPNGQWVQKRSHVDDRSLDGSLIDNLRWTVYLCYKFVAY